MFDHLYQDRRIEIVQLSAPLPNLLQEIHELLVEKEFGGAKYKWLDNLPNPHVITDGNIDVFGNGNGMVITDLAKVLARVTFCKTDTPEIHDPFDLLDFWHKCVA